MALMNKPGWPQRVSFSRVIHGRSCCVFSPLWAMVVDEKKKQDRLRRRPVVFQGLFVKDNVVSETENHASKFNWIVTHNFKINFRI
jgi:hypothetical protein